MPALKDAIDKLKKLIRGRKGRGDGDPGDPMVRVPLKPRPLRGRGAVALAEPDEAGR